MSTDNPSTSNSRGRPPIPEQDLLDELRRLKDFHDCTPTTTTMNRDGEYSAKTYANRFGSWNNALEAVGIDPLPPGRPEYDDTDLLDELRRLNEDLGRVPSTTDMTEYGEYSHLVYYNHFGSWGNALCETEIRE